MKNEDVLLFGKNGFYIAIVLAGFLIYFNSLFSPFVWDDVNQIQNNYIVHSIANFPNFFFGGTYIPNTGKNLAGLYYKPLLSFFYSLIYSIFGPNPTFFHLAQVALHIINSILVFIFLKTFFKEKLAFFLSLIFLVHPIQVEAVSYIAALQEPLFFVFGMSALILYLKGKMNAKRVILIGFLLLCSLLSKETGILFLGAILTYYFLFKFRKSSLAANITLTAIPFLTYLFLRFFVAKIYFQRIPDVPMMTAPIIQRVFTIPAIILFYLKTFFFPKNLLIFQQWFISGPGMDFYIPLVIDLVFFAFISLLGIWIWRNNKENFKIYIFFSMLFILGLGMHLQIIPLDMTVADRWFYFPMVGLLGMAGVTVRGVKPSSLLKNLGIFAAIIIIILLSLRTVMRNTDWWSGIALYSHDLAIKKTDDRLENLLAVELSQAERYDEARVHLENLLKRHLAEPALYVNLAVIDELQGDIAGAKVMYGKIVDTDGTGAAYYNLARITLLREGNAEEAKKLTQKALEKYPLNPNLWIIQALASYKLGNQKEALEEAKKAHALAPDDQTQNIYNKILNNEPI